MTLRLPEMLTAHTSESHKRDHDDYLTNSSDPPMFSSDPPVFSTSLDDYQQPRRKRQHIGSCYGLEIEQDLPTKKTRSRSGIRSAHRQRRPFRKYDSGVYMGSDESLLSELSEAASEHGLLCNTANSTGVDPAVEGDVEDLEADREGTPWFADLDGFMGASLLEKAMQTLEDPGDFAGPVFPYWQEQPEGIRQFHVAQQIAQEKVVDCVDRGEEVVDLSNSYLSQIRAPVLRPLRYHIRQDPHPITSRPAKYKRFTPSLTLFLSNNNLAAIPGELYHLRNLQVLSLRGNNIEELLPAIGQLTSLKELNIASNQLSYLPFELLSLLQGSLKRITLYPNPFIKTTQPLSARFSTRSDLLEGEHKSPNDPHKFHHVNSTRVAFLDISGNPIRGSSPPPSQSLNSHLPLPGSLTPHTAPSSRHKAPSLQETILRNLSLAPELSQLPFHIPASVSPHLHALLQRTYYLTESGGQKCTICRAAFIVPRTEWVEWWARRRSEAVPFLRRGCSWGCFPEGDADDDDDDDDEGRVGGWGWRSGNEMGMDVDLVGGRR